MKTLKLILAALGIIIVLILAIYAMNGGFTKIVIRVEEQGGELMVYESVTGNYMQTPLVTNRIYDSLLNGEQIETTKGIGIFYDDPQLVEKANLRSDAGCIVENYDSTTVAALSAKYQVRIIPRQQYIVAEFPMKGFMSVMIGIMKVYPALDRYCNKHRYANTAITEIYDNVNQKTVYRQKIVTLDGN